VTYLFGRHSEKCSVKIARAVDEVSPWCLRSVFGLAGGIIMCLQIKSIRGNSCACITALHEVLPELLEVVGSARHAARHADDGQLRVSRVVSASSAKISMNPLYHVVLGHVQAGKAGGNRLENAFEDYRRAE
jgi:hypothetical protein